MPHEELRIWLESSHSELGQDLSEDIVPQAWRVFQPEATPQHAEDLLERVEVGIPRKAPEYVDATRRDRDLDVPFHLVLQLGRLLEGQAPQEGLGDVGREEGPALLGRH